MSKEEECIVSTTSSEDNVDTGSLYSIVGDVDELQFIQKYKHQTQIMKQIWIPEKIKSYESIGGFKQ